MRDTENPPTASSAAGAAAASNGTLSNVTIGSNLTHENERYYLVWPDMKLNTTQFEARYALGIRAKL